MVRLSLLLSYNRRCPTSTAQQVKFAKNEGAKTLTYLHQLMSLNLAKNVDIQQIDDSHAARRASVDEDRDPFPRRNEGANRVD
jgi:hypothetical protein